MALFLMARNGYGMQLFFHIGVWPAYDHRTRFSMGLGIADGVLLHLEHTRRTCNWPLENRPLYKKSNMRGMEEDSVAVIKSGLL